MRVELAIGVAAIAGLIWWARKPRDDEGPPHVCSFQPKLKWDDWRRKTFHQVWACDCGRQEEG